MAEVASITEAWIETSRKRRQFMSIDRRLHHGGVDRNSPKAGSKGPDWVASITEAWIETVRNARRG